jgi:hypothetical protein
MTALPPQELARNLAQQAEILDAQGDHVGAAALRVKADAAQKAAEAPGPVFYPVRPSTPVSQVAAASQALLTTEAESV